ncbi:hypothetical protein C4568_04840 [Candidatus Parcubacteria bacterium]|nr:MAG: hypothetical protein C4568_04840 [Candidatus Parcubacteria bacterium]
MVASANTRPLGGDRRVAFFTVVPYTFFELVLYTFGMKHLKQNEIEELRGALEAEKDAVEEELASHGRQQSDTGDWQGSSAGFEGEEADPNDVADQIEELGINTALVEELEQRHKDIEEALEKMDNGTYGTCEECGEEIPADRLEANPAARTCVTHA